MQAGVVRSAPVALVGRDRARSDEVLAAAEADLVEAKARRVRVVRPTACAPRLRPVPPLQGRVVGPLGAGRPNPLLDVAEEIVDSERARAARARSRGLRLVEPSRLLVPNVVVAAREPPGVVAPVGLVVDAAARLECVPVAEGEYVGALAGRLPLELRAEPLADRPTAGLRLGEAHHHRRELALAVRPLEAVHAHGDGRLPALVGGEPREVLPAGVLREAEADSLDVLVVAAHDELHVGGTRLDRRRGRVREHDEERPDHGWARQRAEELGVSRGGGRWRMGMAVERRLELYRKVRHARHP